MQYIYGKGMGSLVHELASNGVDTIHRFRHEDQAGSLIGGSDETEFEDADHDFQPFMQGWLLVPETPPQSAAPSTRPLGGMLR